MEEGKEGVVYVLDKSSVFDLVRPLTFNLVRKSEF